jgi:hypothetical protein
MASSSDVNYSSVARQSLADEVAVFDNQSNDPADIVYFVPANRRARWQAKNSRSQALCVGQHQPGMRKEGAIRFHTVAAGIEITARQNVFRPQNPL